MDEERLLSFKKDLETVIQDKSLTDSIITRMIKSVPGQKKELFAPNTPERDEEFFLNRFRKISKVIEASEVGTTRSLNETFIENIALYLSTRSDYSLDFIVEELNRIKVTSYEELYRHSFSYFLVDLYIQIGSDWVDSTAYVDNGYFKTERTKAKLDVAKHLFYSLLDISFKKLGLENTLKLVSEFLRAFFDEDLKKDSRTHVEIFANAVDYCSNNSEYPIEWALSLAFDRDVDTKNTKSE